MMMRPIVLISHRSRSTTHAQRQGGDDRHQVFRRAHQRQRAAERNQGSGREKGRAIFAAMP